MTVPDKTQGAQLDVGTLLADRYRIMRRLRRSATGSVYLAEKKPPIIYRDLKPENLMLDARNRVTLIDFGIARIIFPVRKGVTAIGTMGYAPPELFSGKIEAASDVYCLGATMFHLLTGVDPQDDPLLIFDFTKNPKPRQLNPELTIGIEALICRAVEYRPEDRWPSIREFGTRA